MNYDIIKKNQYKFFFILPALLLIITFFILPNILNFFYAFTDWSPYKEVVNFRGLRNFIELTADKTIWRDLYTTIKFSIFVTIIQNFIALSLALSLERSTKFNTVMRNIFFIPVLFSVLATGYLFQALLTKRGTINEIIQILTNSDIAILFLGHQTWTLLVLAIVNSWKFYGICMLVYMAGLKLIPGELIEAAKVEGASVWKIITKIKLPLIGPSFTFSLVITFIGCFSAFELPMIMTNGGPARSTEVLNLFIFRNFGMGRWGYATAIGLVLFLFICLFAFPMIIGLRKREVEL
jgi:raffinose/stachyose/melibiose transport system permease protein